MGAAQAIRVDMAGKGDTKILLTRPEEAARKFAAELGPDAGHIVIAPVLRIEERDPSLPDLEGYAIVMTSQIAAAIAAKRGLLRGRELYAVGPKTAEIARLAGARVVHQAETATALTAHLLADRPDHRLIHLCGSHVAVDLALTLKKAEIETEKAIIYEQVRQELTPESREILALPGTVIVPVFSPRSAQILSDELGNARIGAEIHLVCISDAVCRAWSGPVPASRCRAASPDGAAMVEAIRKLSARLG